MTRILYWNIENFSVNKFWDNSRKRKRGSSGTGAQQAVYRLRYFRYAFDNGTAANAAHTPEIVVIVELESGVTVPGGLVTGNGPTATQNLVTEIRNRTGNNNWMAVPSLYAGPREGVIVLYNSANLIFTGPNIWPGGVGPSAIPPAPASPYPAAWNPYIRTGALSRAIPAGAQYNANRWENQMAARVAGFTSYNPAVTPLVPAPGGMPLPGAAMDGNLGPRTPYMTTFFRPAAGAAPAENITLFAIHAPANANAAYNYMTNLACTQEIAAAPLGNERKVVVGDFNLNLFNGTGALRQRYRYFQQLWYSIGVVPTGGGPPNPPLGYYDYFGTHLMPDNNARNWSNAGFPRYYPGYGYMSDINTKCIDNIFATSPNFQNTTILNPVVGSPYNVLPGGGAPVWLTAAMQGHFAIHCLCPCYNLQKFPQWQAPPFAPGMNTYFRGWQNFGRIRSTSDHLPIIADF